MTSLYLIWIGIGSIIGWLKRGVALPRWRVEMKLAVGLWPLLLAAPCTAVVLEKPAQHKRLLPRGLLRPYIGGWEQQGCYVWAAKPGASSGGQKWTLQVCSSYNCIVLVVQLFESISLHISNDREKHLYLVKKNRLKEPIVFAITFRTTGTRHYMHGNYKSLAKFLHLTVKELLMSCQKSRRLSEFSSYKSSLQELLPWKRHSKK